MAKFWVPDSYNPSDNPSYYLLHNGSQKADEFMQEILEDKGL